MGYAAERRFGPAEFEDARWDAGATWPGRGDRAGAGGAGFAGLGDARGWWRWQFAGAPEGHEVVEPGEQGVQEGIDQIEHCALGAILPP